MTDDPNPNTQRDPRPDAPASNEDTAADGAQAVAQSTAEALVKVERQRDEYFDQLQRTRAEFVNYQKRTRAQAEANRVYAIVPLALDLIAVLDNFERAADAARGAGAPTIVEGLTMVQKQLSSILAKHGIEPIDALGQPFDPTIHEAISQQISAEHPEGTVVAVLSRGYRLLDRVLRPAKVAVSVRPPEGETDH